MGTSGLIEKLLAGTANLLNKVRKTRGYSIVVYENGKVTEVIV